MSDGQIIKTALKLKENYPDSWFDIVVEKFGFRKVISLLGKINNN